MHDACHTTSPRAGEAPAGADARPEPEPEPALDLDRLVWDPEYREETRAHWRRET